MSAPTAKTSTAPAHVITQIRRGENVDGEALLKWYENDCPAWLRHVGMSPDTAALLSHLPDPSKWSHVGIIGGKT